MILLARPIQKISFFLSFVVVSWGQPALIGWLGAVSSILGFALFFSIFNSETTRKQKVILSTLWFAAVQLVQLSWMTSIEFQGYYILVVYVVLALVLGLQFSLFTLAVPSQGFLSWSRLIACSALWACLEWSRLFFLCGLSLNPIGLALSYFTLSLQWASIWGVLGLSFWVMLTNLAALNCLRSLIPSALNNVLFKRLKASNSIDFKKILPVAMLAIIPYLFGWVHIQYHTTEAEKNVNTMDVALLQTSLRPSEKIPYPLKMQEFIRPFQQWDQIMRALSSLKQQHLDLLVFPEAVVPLQADFAVYPFSQVKESLIALWGEEIVSQFPPLQPPYAGVCSSKGVEEMCVSNLFWSQTLCNYLHTEMVIGLDFTDLKSRKNFNSAFYLKPQQAQVQRYDKQILLPLAEYLPFSFLKPLTRRYGITDFFTQGEEFKLWGDKSLFSPCICYEETFSGLIRGAKTLGAQMVVNLTNDNYYPDSTLHRQHLFHARLRSVENGVPLIRSCNAGVSAVIDSLGRVVGQMEEGVSGVVQCKLNSYVYKPLFSFYGESMVIALFFIIIICYWGIPRKTP